MKLIDLTETDSTNEYLKRGNFSGDVCVVAKRQTGGRGTKGRSFISQEGGVYASFQREYKNFPAENAFKIMINACTAVCKTLERFGVHPVIRWPNDVLAGGLKISGTLIENTFSNGYISRSIVGIGINVNNALPPELNGIATSLSEVLGHTVELDGLIGVLIKNMRSIYSVGEYKRYINWLGEPITLLRGDAAEQVTAVDISERGELICARGDEVFNVNSAEVSLRL